MLSSKWGEGHKKKKKENEKVEFVKVAGDGIDNKQNSFQKNSGDSELNILGDINLNVPINIPIANQGTGGSMNKESGPGNLTDDDSAEFLL